MINTFAFFDDFALQQRHQFKRRYFQAEIIPDSGYSDHIFRSTYSSIVYVPELDKYRVWYNINQVACILGKQSEHCMLALAESDDGIHFAPCNVGAVGVENIKNIVYSGLGNSIHGATVMYDPADADPNARYKCAASIDEPGTIMAYAPSIIATSPDGIHWDNHDCKMCWNNYWSDSYNALFFNPVLELYQVIFRASGTDRRICTSTSKDLLHWSGPRLVLMPDPEDPPGTEFYGMPVFYHEGIFYGYLWRFETDQDDPIAYKMAGTVFSELVYSYDGLCWQRTRQPAVAAQQVGSYGFTGNYLYNSCLNRKQDAWLTTSTFPRCGHAHGMYEQSGNHLPPAVDVNAPDGTIHPICTIRPGRYCGLQSVGNAFLRTKNFFLIKNDLSINVAAPYGEMRVQLSDSHNRPVPGFTFDDCIPFRGDVLKYHPQWKKRSLDEAAGKLFGLEIEMNEGCIYGISGSFYPFHSALPQYSYGKVVPAAQEVFGTLDKAPDYESIEF